VGEVFRVEYTPQPRRRVIRGSFVPYVHSYCMMHNC